MRSGDSGLGGSFFHGLTPGGLGGGDSSSMSSGDSGLGGSFFHGLTPLGRGGGDSSSIGSGDSALGGSLFHGLTPGGRGGGDSSSIDSGDSGFGGSFFHDGFPPGGRGGGGSSSICSGLGGSFFQDLSPDGLGGVGSASTLSGDASLAAQGGLVLCPGGSGGLVFSGGFLGSSLAGGAGFFTNGLGKGGASSLADFAPAGFFDQLGLGGGAVVGASSLLSTGVFFAHGGLGFSSAGSAGFFPHLGLVSLSSAGFGAAFFFIQGLGGGEPLGGSSSAGFFFAHGLGGGWVFGGSSSSSAGFGAVFFAQGLAGGGPFGGSSSASSVGFFIHGLLAAGALFFLGIAPEKRKKRGYFGFLSRKVQFAFFKALRSRFSLLSTLFWVLATENCTIIIALNIRSTKFQGYTRENHFVNSPST